MLAQLEEGVEGALTALEAMRAAEGEALDADLRGRLDRILELAASFQARSGQVMEAATERLRKRIEQIRQEVGSVDEARLHQEIVIAADRLDITEELVRLRSHVDQFQAILKRIREYIAADDRVDHNVTEMAHMTEFQDSSIAINLYYFTKTTNWVTWREIMEEHMLAFLAIIEEEGSSMAFPTRTIHIEGQEFPLPNSTIEAN